MKKIVSLLGLLLLVVQTGLAAGAPSGYTSTHGTLYFPTGDTTKSSGYSNVSGRVYLLDYDFVTSKEGSDWNLIENGVKSISYSVESSTGHFFSKSFADFTRDYSWFGPKESDGKVRWDEGLTVWTVYAGPHVVYPTIKSTPMKTQSSCNVVYYNHPCTLHNPCNDYSHCVSAVGQYDTAFKGTWEDPGNIGLYEPFSWYISVISSSLTTVEDKIYATDGGTVASLSIADNALSVRAKGKNSAYAEFNVGSLNLCTSTDGKTYPRTSMIN